MDLKSKDLIIIAHSHGLWKGIVSHISKSRLYYYYLSDYTADNFNKSIRPTILYNFNKSRIFKITPNLLDQKDNENYNKIINQWQ